MFRQEDKITLTCADTINRSGKILDFYIKFPIEKEIDIPQDILKMNVYEYCNGYESYICKVFKICVGKISKFSEICNLNSSKIKIEPNILKGLDSTDDLVCYYIDEEGKYNIYDKVNNGDIVVENIEKLKKVLIKISDSFKNIKESVSTIKELGIVTEDKNKVKQLQKVNKVD